MLVLAVLPALALACLRPGTGWRDAIIRASLLWGTTAVVSAEVLGAAGMLGPAPVRAFWALLTTAALAVAWRKRRVVASSLPFLTDALIATPILSLTLLIFAAGTLVTGLASAPNNWDSLAYHLPKVEHWIQTGSLAPTPFALLTEGSRAPGAEMLLLHTRLLAADSGFLNTVQWAAWVIGVVATATAASHLGASQAGQTGAAVFVGTVPMVVLQASSTQTDLIGAAWVAIMLERVLMFRKAPSISVALGVGTALALAFVTKSSATLAAAPIGVWFGFLLLRHWGLDRRTILSLAGCAGLIVVLNAGWLARNYQIFETALGPPRPALRSANYRPGVIAANAIRYFTAHSLVPNLAVNRAIVASARDAFARIGLQEDAPGTVLRRFSDVLTVKPRMRILHEDVASAPVQVLLVGVALLVLLVRPIETDRRGHAALLLCLLGSLLLFAGLLRWQLYGNRLHVPIWFLAGPVVGAVLFERRGTLSTVCLVLALCTGLPPLISNWSRPLWPVFPDQSPSVLVSTTAAELFSQDPLDRQAYEAAVSEIMRTPKPRIGLVMRPGSSEYPLWWLLQQQHAEATIRHVGQVYGPSEPAFSPDVILVLDYAQRFDGNLGAPQETYRLVLERGPARVWQR